MLVLGVSDVEMWPDMRYYAARPVKQQSMFTACWFNFLYQAKGRDNSNNVEIFTKNMTLFNFQTCFDGTSIIVSVTVKIVSVSYIIVR